MTRRAARVLLESAASSAALATAGCAMAPTYDVMGSLFPAWLVCIVVGILLAVLSRWLLVRYRISLVYPVIVYPCLAAVFTFAVWLIFFQQ
jgi:fructose-specific phosphotransferase system IIC component